jgi:hypothetical protein
MLRPLERFPWQASWEVCLTLPSVGSGCVTSVLRFQLWLHLLHLREKLALSLNIVFLPINALLAEEKVLLRQPTS